MHRLSPRVHGYIDYAAVAFLALAPVLFGFSSTATTIAWVLAFAQLGMSLVTRYPLGIAPVLPFTVHGAIELATSIFLVAAPFLFGFNDHDTSARNVFIASGIGLFGVWLTTDYRAVDRDYDVEREVDYRREYDYGYGRQTGDYTHA